jgi:CBS domain-containing protein
VVTARPGDPIQEKAALMVHRRIRRLPVVDGRGRLVGILSRKDLIRTLVEKRAEKRKRKPGKGGSRG